MPTLPEAVNLARNVCFANSYEAGWWSDPLTGRDIGVGAQVPTKLLLIHSEISEACEAWRKGAMDDKLPSRQGIEVELADALIRICDLAGALGLDLGGAVEDKLLYNQTRLDHQREHRREAGGKKF